VAASAAAAEREVGLPSLQVAEEEVFTERAGMASVTQQAAAGLRSGQVVPREELEGVEAADSSQPAGRAVILEAEAAAA
jgi:hypothetical protein